jgi:adenosylmethionine-8-amino-7-oxononanoate aminotransferase
MPFIGSTSLTHFCVVIQGAGGMLMIDPLFQRVLVSECRSRKIPVIFDEVFTGFWRLGVEVIFGNTFPEDN